MSNVLGFQNNKIYSLDHGGRYSPGWENGDLTLQHWESLGIMW